VVLFCGGLGTRIRGYSDALPKPMIPVGSFPMLWYIMQYYSSFGHNDFTLCLGYKASTIKEFFLKYRPGFFNDCVVSDHAGKVEILRRPTDDRRITMIDTGIWRSIGERLWAVHPTRA
jgi:glucose-1-phosphate cytidylyltransferase